MYGTSSPHKTNTSRPQVKSQSSHSEVNAGAQLLVSKNSMFGSDKSPVCGRSKYHTQKV